MVTIVVVGATVAVVVVALAVEVVGATVVMFPIAAEVTLSFNTLVYSGVVVFGATAVVVSAAVVVVVDVVGAAVVVEVVKVTLRYVHICTAAEQMEKSESMTFKVEEGDCAVTTPALEAEEQSENLEFDTVNEMAPMSSAPPDLRT